MANELITPGIYNVEYFSGAQVAVYIGDVWVDEITSLQFSVRQTKQPLYGYADTLFRTVSKGQVLVQGSFTINFKEAGYLWLVLNEYSSKNGHGNLLRPITSSQDIERKNIERFVDGETGTFETGTTSDRNQLLSDLAAQAALTGFASNQRLAGTAGDDIRFNGPSDTHGVGLAENIFEEFEDYLWAVDQDDLDEATRRADEPALNNFDMYIAYGDFAGDNRYNHTIQKLSGVHIIGSSKIVNADGTPIQEQYDFIARNQV